MQWSGGVPLYSQSTNLERRKRKNLFTGANVETIW